MKALLGYERNTNMLCFKVPLISTTTLQISIRCEILGSHSGVAEDSSLAGMLRPAYWQIITHVSEYLTLEGPCIIFCNINTFQRDTQCCSTDCLLMHRCQLYMFRTVTVHPQEFLFRCCMCRLWYVVRTALSDTSRWYSVLPQMLYQPDVSAHTIVCTYSI